MEITESVTHICGFCQRQFARASSLEVHVCEPKRRHGERDETGVRIGFNTWLRFFEITQGSSRLKTWDDFVKSSYYKAFVKFGRHVTDIRAINVAAFADWLIQKNRKIDHWCRDNVYGEWLAEYIKIEPATDAMARALETAIDWSEKNNSVSQHILRYGNANHVSYLISTGRISPWVLYNTDSGMKFLNDITADNLTVIWNMIDSDFWQKKFRDYPSDAEYVRQMMSQAGW